jgi:hypothetical protein
LILCLVTQPGNYSVGRAFDIWFWLAFLNLKLKQHWNGRYKSGRAVVINKHFLEWPNH